MGIHGLLPFLKKIHTPVNISQFKGCTVAIDAYCWLHKGAFSCAEKLALGEKTEQYVYYCMKYVDCLLRNDVKPVLVFDGCHLPSKKDVEVSRRERRELNRKKAAQLLREGKRAEAKECLQRCVDITSQMALELMNACRARGVDCIVAPYEADAQLAYLNKAGIAEVIITEDSDLLLFGCQKVIFKMDFYGNGVLIEQSRLNEVVEIQDGFYTFDKFRYMCILSGCDYLPSLPGIGLAKACKVFKVARQTDIRQLLRKLPSYLKMSLVVTDDYIEGFIRADNTFLYQLAFDPLTRKLCPLTPYTPEVDLEELRYAGPYFSNKLALQIALGNVEIHNHEKIADFDPHTFVPKYAKKQDHKMHHLLSIWNPGYRPRSKTDDPSKAKVEDVDVGRPRLAGKEVQVKNTLTKRSPRKRVREVPDGLDVKTDLELAALYSAPPNPRKRRRESEELLRQSPPPASSTLPKLSDSGDEDDHSKSHPAEKKQVLSPSKLSNQTPPKPFRRVDNALSWMDQESAVTVSPEEKENSGRDVSSRRNKFAVSALAKRARFSLDGPAVPGVKVQVKSRYFSSTLTLPDCSVALHKRTTPEETPSATENEASSAASQKGQHRSADDDSITSSRSPLLDPDQSTSQNEAEGMPAKETSLSSRFGYSADRLEKKTEPQSQARDCLSQGSYPPQKHCKTWNRWSPGSAFSWSTFRFTKASSTPTLSSFVHTSANSNKPFKRVLTEEKNPAEELTPPMQELSGGQGDWSQASQNSVGGVSDNSFPGRSTSSQSQRGDGEDDSCSDLAGSPCSLADMNASQHSNLYSIDSDCFPNSQDMVDLTDCDGFSRKSGKSSDWASPATSSQAFLKSPKMTPRATSGTGARKCRVSGLSRGKKKTSPQADEKQQKIQDMFSRFAYHKKEQLDSLPDTRLDDPSAPGSATPSSCPQHPTEAHRMLVL